MQSASSEKANSSEVSKAWSGREAAIIATSHLISDGDAVFIGQGLPTIAALFAKRSHAPTSVIMHEYGVVDADPPYAVELANPAFAERAAYLSDMIDALGCMIYDVDIAILGAAQIDRFGNINTTSIGNYTKPKLRISGSGGANDIGSSSPSLVVLMDNQSAEKMPESVDYVTTPGFFRGDPGARRRLGLEGSGPNMLVTNLGLYKFSKTTGEMYLDALQPGVSVEEIRANTGWNINTKKRSREDIALPLPWELEILRSLDPQHVYLK